jgi:pantoate kinase
MKQAKAFAPCHVTGVFEIVDHEKDPLHVGSRGAGVSLSRGIETTVKVDEKRGNSVQVRTNGLISSSAQVSNRVLDIFASRFQEVRNSHVDVEHHVEVPIGAGFGTSGAGALSLALALNEAFGLGLSETKAAQIAHMAEVDCRTGLGTVIAEAYGGLEIRTEAGAPGIGEIECVPVSKDVAVACLVFGPLSTRKYLTDKSTRKRINEFGERMVDKLLETPTPQNFMGVSRQFAEHVGLITDRMRKLLNATDKTGVVCSMPMFGESVFTLAEPEDLKKIVRVFKENHPGEVTVVSEIDWEGARLLH